MALREVKVEYKPNPKQIQAHTLSAKYRGFCGGWGNGKTTWGCVEFFATLLEFPGTKSIVARKTRPELKATTWDMLLNGDNASAGGWAGIPRECIKTYNKSDLYIELFNGSQIFGLGLDDPKKLENFNLGLFWIDQAEEVEEDIFLKFHGRMRQLNAPREGLLTFNPNGHNWLWRRFIDKGRRSSWRKTYKCIEATTYDNPNLPQDYLDQFDGLPDHWYQRFVMGSHEVFVGQIFTDLDPAVHVCQPFHIPSDWERWSCIDPGIRNEGCVSWAARDFDRNVYYYREILEANQPVSWWAATIFDAEQENDWGGPDEEMHRSLIGREANQRSQTDGKTVLSVFNECGLYPEYADRDPSARISRITEYLRPTPGHANPFTDERGVMGEIVPAPRLYIFADCDKLLEYLPQYRWKPQRSNFSEEAPAEKPRSKDDHNIDNLGHMLVAFDEDPEPEAKNVANANPEQKFVEDHFEKALAEAGGTP